MELEAAAADSLRPLVGGRRKHVPPPGAVCPNCDTPLKGPYCYVCGQGADTHKRSLRHLIWEAFEGLFELDGRLLRTAPALFVRPGGLARDYMEGRIARHVPPFRTFLIALLLFIFAAQHAAHEATLSNARTKAAETAALATPQGRAAAAAKRRAEAADELKSDLADAAADRTAALEDPDTNKAKAQASYAARVARANARNARRLQSADRVAQGLPAELPDKVQLSADEGSSGWFKKGVHRATDNPDYYWSVVFDWGHRAAVLLLPIVGFSLALVYRKRRNLFVYDHLQVAMNWLSFVFLLSALGLMLPFGWMGWWFGAVGLWSLVNLFQTLRGAYGSSLLGATLKTLVVWWIGAMASFILMIGLLVLAVAEL